MFGPVWNSVGLVTLAWFSAVTVFGHALHEHGPHHHEDVTCCATSTHADLDHAPGAAGFSGDRRSSTEDCFACDFYSSCQQVVPPPASISLHSCGQTVRLSSDHFVPIAGAASYDPRGPPATVALAEAAPEGLAVDA